MSPLYLTTLYLHGEQVFFTEAAMFFTSVQTEQTKHTTTGSLSCLEGEGGVRGI